LNQNKNNYSIGEEEHNTGTDRYLITYADLITLLLGLFVILYAISKVDEAKYKELSQAFTQYFKTEKPKVLAGGIGVMQGNKQGLPEPILPPSEKSIKQIKEEIEKKLDSYIQKGEIKLKSTDRDIVLNVAEKLLFKSGSDLVEPEGLTVLDTLSLILSGIQKQIMVDGHADSDGIKTAKFPSNWHLSQARALNVAYKMMNSGVPETNMSIRAFGSQRPIADNATQEGKTQNRRVEITISELPHNAPSKEGYSK
jgi:chemotaxis protein MotB